MSGKEVSYSMTLLFNEKSNINVMKDYNDSAFASRATPVIVEPNPIMTALGADYQVSCKTSIENIKSLVKSESSPN
jgi:hypothetical protein